MAFLQFRQLQHRQLPAPGPQPQRRRRSAAGHGGGHGRMAWVPGGCPVGAPGHRKTRLGWVDSAGNWLNLVET